MTVSRGPPAPPQAENFLDHRFVRLVYEGSGEERRDRDWRKSAARGGGGQGLIGRVTSTLAPNGGYALSSQIRVEAPLAPLHAARSDGRWSPSPAPGRRSR